MKKDLLILEEDKQYARERIAELDTQIIDLGPEFRKAFTQTSETWHDNAPFEAVRDQQSILAAERHHLKLTLRSSLPSIPKQKKSVVGIGSIVHVINKKTNKKTIYFIAGDWTYRAGHKVDGAIIMSRKSPLALAMLGKKINDEVIFNNTLLITEIEQKNS
ncbi:MAG: GreA/GreB family elongation factor [Candidatus Saccharibacteria bacterium]